MTEPQVQFKKLYNARCILESELGHIHKVITDEIDCQDRRVKVERLSSVSKNAFSEQIQKIGGLVVLAIVTENTESIFPALEQ